MTFDASIIYYVLGTVFLCILTFNLKSPGKRIEHKIFPKGELDSSTVMRSIGQLLGPPLVGGNQITLLQNGDEIFPAMLDAVRAAKKSITFETFIYWSGDIGKTFADVLSAKAREGVRAHVLIDWIGSQRIDSKLLKDMREAGVDVHFYRPLRWYNLTRLNNRTHRKILVVDGIVGFTGGVGIADQWKGHAEDQNHWRDAHFKIKGPVVSQLQSAFMDNWNATHPEVLHGESYFPELHPEGNSLGQVFKSSPEEGSGSVRLMYLYAIAHAKKSVLIASAYFVPDTHVRELLLEARKRGVKIEVILPGKKIDTEVTRRASRAVWGELLQAGIQIYEYQPTMFHCKYMIVDEVWTSVGSTNLDNRSFRLNDECNLNVIDREWAKLLTSTFTADRNHAREMTFSEWKKRPLKEKVIEWLSSLILKSQL